MVFVSGLSGLIYQVVWHRYLGILLGAQARATAIILGVFLGGISVGYFFFGRWSRKSTRNLLTTYAVVELGMALWGALFPTLFHTLTPVTGWMYHILGVNNLLTDFVISIVLVGPPTFLMGGTLPLLTQAFSESLQKASRLHASIYSWNTIGACAGCIAAGYFMIPMVGLASGSLIASLGNLISAACCYFVFARQTSPVTDAARGDGARVPLTARQIGLMTIGFLSGFYIISLESIVIRLMGLSSGASYYNFTLVVSIFILGLGFGSLTASRIDGYRMGRLTFNQLAVAATLLILFYSGNYWSYWVHLLRSAIRDGGENFYLYQGLLGLLYTSFLLLPISLAGFTLPLCFHFLKDTKEGLGDRVGQLYSLNTLGCVLGAVMGGYWLLHWFNLDQVFKLCIVLSLVGAAIAVELARRELHWSPVRVGATSSLCGLLIYLVVTAPPYDRRRFTQAFRHSEPIPGVTYEGAEAFGAYLSRSTEYAVFRDGPNTSVGIGVSRENGVESSRSIFVNGKSDGNTRGDRLTTVLLAHLPGLLARHIERACVIGFGTGMTIGTLSLYPEVNQIDVAEISGTILENTKEFDAYNHGVSHNPKVRFHEMDAFRWLNGAAAPYNIIISEPSNPWVMGIENLYSDEFYQIARRQLTAEGMFVQWIHTYSFNDDLFRTVLATLRRTFPHISVFQMRGGDMALIGTQYAFDGSDIERGRLRYATPAVMADLSESDIHNLETVLGYEVIPDGVVSALAPEGTPIHRLENPRLSNGAARAFFSNQSSEILRSRKQVKEFFNGSLKNSLLGIHFRGAAGYPKPLVSSFLAAYCRDGFASNRILCEEVATMGVLMGIEGEAGPSLSAESRELVNYLNRPHNGPFTKESLKDYSANLEKFKATYSPLARLSVTPLINELDRCLRTVSPQSDIYGDCLLNRVVLGETFLLRSDSAPWISRYMDWFSRLASNAENYNRFQEARDILRKLAEYRKD